jgi:hypothetical protein
MLRKKQTIDTDFRESKTPRDHIPKLSTWDVVKEKDIKTIKTNQKDVLSKLHPSNSNRPSIRNGRRRRRP